MDSEGIEIVPYKECWYEEIAAFYSGHGWDAPPIQAVLSDTGFVAVSGDEKLAVGFLYKTNSAVFILEWTATNPKAPLKVRTKAFKLLVRTVMALCKKVKPESHLFQFTPNEAIIRTYKKLGFTETEKASILHWY